MDDARDLELEASISFQGIVPGGLIVHPDKQHLVYSIGNTVVIEEICSKKKELLQGHSDNITCLAISKNGKYIASGQCTHMGFKADVIIWDYHQRSQYCCLPPLHKVKVEALAFSPNALYLATLGGQDDGSVVIWNIEFKEPICGEPVQVKSAGTARCLKFSNLSDDLFVTAGDHNLRVWTLDKKNRKIRPVDVNMGKLKREIKCIEIKDDDKYVYCGTSTGDIVGINIDTQLFQFKGPEKTFSKGVSSIVILKNDNLLVGAGDGTVEELVVQKSKGTCVIKSLKPRKQATVDGDVTSIAIRGEGHQFFVGTNQNNIYKFNLSEFNKPTGVELVATCHCYEVNDVIIPCEELFITCSRDDIRVWRLETNQELLKIREPNKTCNAIQMLEEKVIVSAWDDGKIRGYGSQSGKERFVIKDAHSKGVTALAVFKNGKKIVSGGGEGQVRIWTNVLGTPWMEASMNEHQGLVSCIKLNPQNTRCVSASEDGSCIIWDLESHKRDKVMFADTLFKCVTFAGDRDGVLVGDFLITSGNDRKICFWDAVVDGSEIRHCEGSKSGSVNGLDLSCDGKYFVTGGDDKLIKVWDSNRMVVTHVGKGHSANIRRVMISPQGRHIVSVSADGALLRWKFPFECHS